MCYSSQTNLKVDPEKSFVNYHKGVFENQEIHDNFSKMLIDSISKYIMNNKISNFDSINHLIYQGVLKKQKVLLGDMPEILLRLILGNTVYIEEVKLF